MAKFKRYIGLLVAIFVLVVAFAPARTKDYRDYYYPNATRLTFMTDTIAADFLKPEEKLTEMWKAVSDRMNRCPPFTESIQASRSSMRSDGCGKNDWLFSTLAQQYLLEIQPYEPDIAKLVDQYLAYSESYVQPKMNGFDPEPSRDQRILALEKRIGVAEAKFLHENKGKILAPHYMLHGIFLLLVLLIVVFRELVGSLVLSPLTLLLALGKAGGKATKSLHDKV